MTSLNGALTDAWIKDLTSRELASSALARIYYVFKRLLSRAREYGAPVESALRKLRGKFAKKTKKERVFISSAKINALADLLEKEESSAARVLLLILLTDAAKSEILSARRDRLDLANRFLEVRGYNGKPRRLWLGERALRLVQSLPAQDSPWLFPGRDPNKHLSDVFAVWDNARKKCGLPNTRVQDLKNNFRAWEERTAQSRARHETSEELVILGFSYISRAGCETDIANILMDDAKKALPIDAPQNCALYLALELSETSRKSLSGANLSPPHPYGWPKNWDSKALTPT